MAVSWERRCWGDLATLEYGRALRAYSRSGGRYPVYGTNGLIGWHSQPLCPHPGVIIGRKGAYRAVHYSKTPFFVIDTAFYLEPKVPLDLRWAYYELLTHDINGMDSGSAIPSTSRDAFYALPVRVPPLSEQRAIAHVLGTLDDKIELNRRMNETLEAMARAIFKSWFVDFDPVRAKAEGRQPVGMDAETAALFPDRLEDRAGERIPAGWTVTGLDGIATFTNGLPLQDYPPQGGSSLPVIKIAQMRRGDTEGAERANANLEGCYVVDDGDVLFSWSGSLEVTIWCGGRGALNQHIFKVTSKTYPKWFYYLWTKHHLDKFRAIAAGKATTMGHIQRHHLSEAKVLVPPAKLMRAMDAVMAPLLRCRVNNSLEARTLGAIRDALLPKLVSGQLRVPAPERIAPDDGG